MRVTRGLVRRRLVWLLLLLAGALTALIGRLVFLQIVQAPWLAQRALDLHTRTIKLMGTRGSILAAGGQELAYTATAPSILAVPNQIANKASVAAALAPILNMPADQIQQAISKAASNVYIQPGGRRMTEAQTQAVRDLHLPGVYITEEGKRAYPYGTLAAQVLGVVGVDGGLTGVEKTYDNFLAGQNGYIGYLSTAKGKTIPGEGETYQPMTPGDDVQLTLQLPIQQIVEREIERVVAEYQPNHVTAVVENPQTGAVVAMANYPSFNPAEWRNYPQQTYNRNLAIWQTFEPGSTFKIVTLSAALQQKKVNLSDGFYDPGYYEVAGHRIRCWKAGGHGSQSFLNVVENSCNPGFIALGERLGKNALFHYITDFGFGKKTGIDLPGESSGILFRLSKVGPLELATTAFGQGVSVTSIQQVMALGAVANGGKLMRPYVVQDIKNAQTGMVVLHQEPLVVRQVISAETATLVRQALESVVAKGSGKNAYRDGYRIAGKTGTAQVVVNGRYSGQHYIVSFIGMAPANHPKLVAYLAIDYPRPRNGAPVFGGVIAAPVVGRILADSLTEMQVPPDPNGLPRKYNYYEQPPIAVPNLVGLTLSDVRRATIESTAMLRTMVSGAGSVVIAQSPTAGVKVPPGSTVRIFLGNPPAQ